MQTFWITSQGQAVLAVRTFGTEETHQIIAQDGYPGLLSPARGDAGMTRLAMTPGITCLSHQSFEGILGGTHDLLSMCGLAPCSPDEHALLNHAARWLNLLRASPRLMPPDAGAVAQARHALAAAVAAWPLTQLVR